MKEFCRFLKFIFFCILAAIIEFLFMKIVLHFFTLSYIIEKIVSLIIFVYFDFKLNKIFTFESGASNLSSLIKLYVFYIIFSIISNSIFHFNNSTFIIIMVSIINVLFEFYYQKYYIFKDNIDNSPVKIKM